MPPRPSTEEEAANRNESIEGDYLMSPREVREYLGLSRGLTYRLLHEGGIPVIRLGNGGRTIIRVRRSDVEAFLAARTER